MKSPPVLVPAITPTGLASGIVTEAPERLSAGTAIVAPAACVIAPPDVRFSAVVIFSNAPPAPFDKADWIAIPPLLELPMRSVPAVIVLSSALDNSSVLFIMFVSSATPRRMGVVAVYGVSVTALAPALIVPLLSAILSALKAMLPPAVTAAGLPSVPPVTTFRP